ncbi:MAG: L-rhamnose/proton symporter RhaT [Verrucomicrobiota bacterium]|jgi:L-rhamnose-H+ transport protein
MGANPFLGVFFHWLGGLASGSFYVPYRGVKKWSWETYWLVGGFFSWIICPWVFAYFMTNDLMAVLQQQSASTLWWTYFFGLLWGFGGLTFGLTMRYLGMSLGMGVALGYCAAFGTLVPPIFKALMPDLPVGSSIVEIARSTSGQVTLAGVGVCLAGIGIAALAGFTKEKEMPEEEKKKVITEFSFKKGILVATFSGIMSACFAFALQAGKHINEASKAAGTKELWTGLPALTVLLLGGFTTNFIWCVLLNIKNRSAYQYVASEVRPEHAHHGGSGSGERAPAEAAAIAPADLKVPMLCNYLFSALAGTTWYFQFFFYTMGATQMGKYDFASWTLHMASIIIFSTMWGWILHEWKGSSKKAHALIAAGIAMLVLSTIIIGYGTYLKARQ